MKRFLFPLAVGLLLLAVVSQYTTVSAKETWVSVRTKNFFLLGNGGEKEIREVGLKLEQFREVFTHIFPRMKFSTPVPTTVVVFKSDSSYRPFKPSANTAGYFQPGPDVNYITLTTQLRGEQNPFSVIFHEYTHLLLENNLSSVPVWFNEGLAEYYSTFSITDDQKFVLGEPIATHVFLLRQSKMLPLRTLFQIDLKSPQYNEKNKQSIFYAQSWALMHYLMIGKAGRLPQLNKFIDLVNSNVPVEPAFQQAFEMPFETMEKELREYVSQDRYTISRAHFEKKLELDTSVVAKELSEAEVQAYLGDLLLHSRRAEAYTYLEKALKLDPNLGMAHASLGMAYFREGKIKEAHASLERAVAANSQNYLAHYYYAFALSRSGFGDGPSVAGYPPGVAAKIREHVQKAIALRPDFPESYSLLAFVSMVTEENMDEAIVSLRRIVNVTPGRHDLVFMLGQLYLHNGDFKQARQLLEQVTKSKADEEVRQRAESLLKQITLMEEHSARNEAAKRLAAETGATVVVSAGGGGGGAPQEPADPSSYLRDALRKPATGETQVQGTLVRIECDAKGMVFVIQTATSMLKLRTTSFEGIAITTFDPTIKGDITCGPRKPENVVIVTYVPNADKKLKIDGLLKSIEFVPSDFKLKP
jgi:FimV-like protein